MLSSDLSSFARSGPTPLRNSTGVSRKLLATVAKIRKRSCVTSLLMFHLELITEINAPQQLCFDLSRSIDAHLSSLEHTQEKAIDGVTHGFINQGERVTWKAKHVGFTFRMTVEITTMQSPDYFCDEMLSGPFKSMKHEHFFTSENNITRMTDRFECAAPLGILGKLAEFIFLKNYMKRLLSKRNSALKQMAETNKKDE